MTNLNVDIVMNYIEECNCIDDDCLYKYYIDGYPTYDIDVDGFVIATVSVTRHGDVVVDWRNNSFRLDERVQQYIEMAKIEAEQYKK